MDRSQAGVVARLDEVAGLITSLEAEVGERLEGHDRRDAKILGWELVGGVVAMFGSGLSIFAALQNPPL